MSPTDEAPGPTLRVIRGDATDEEIAALLAVVLGRSGGSSEAAAAGPTSVWSDRASGLRRPAHPGPGAWRASAWPR